MLKIGETFTIDGIYKRRTFWEWLKRKPKKLQKLKVITEEQGYVEYQKTECLNYD